MMRIAFMSDLHREFYPDGTRVISREELLAHEEGRWEYVPFKPFGPDLSKLRGRCDVLVIPGDFDVGDGTAYLRSAAEYLGVPVVYVPGNHEFYGGHFERVMGQLRASLPAGGAHLLDRSELVLSAPDGRPVRLLGCILWTDFGLYGDDNRLRCKQLAGSLINDYSRIAAGEPVDAERRLYRRLTPSDTHGFHIRDRNWLEGKLEEPFDGETVVVTHMAPSMRSVPERYKEDPLSAAFASSLDVLIERTQPALWIHGHTHDSFDYHIGRTRVVCNPHGYYGRELNQNFREDLVVDIISDGPVQAKFVEKRPESVRRKDWTME